MKDNVLRYVLAAGIGALAVYGLAWPETHVPYPEVIVPAARIEMREPDTVRTFVDRIRFVAAEPVQVARAVGGASNEVAAFCRPSVLAVTDTVVDTLVVPRLLLRSVSYDPAWLWGSDKLLLTGPTSTGDLKALELDYSVRGGFTARTSGDSVLVRYPRTAVVHDVIEVASVLYTAIDLLSKVVR